MTELQGIYSSHMLLRSRRVESEAFEFDNFGPIPSSGNSHFQIEATWKPFLWKRVLFAWEFKIMFMSMVLH